MRKDRIHWGGSVSGLLAGQNTVILDAIQLPEPFKVVSIYGSFFAVTNGGQARNLEGVVLSLRNAFSNSAAFNTNAQLVNLGGGGVPLAPVTFSNLFAFEGNPGAVGSLCVQNICIPFDGYVLGNGGLGADLYLWGAAIVAPDSITFDLLMEIEF